MNKRIRYTKQTDGTYKGTKFYKANDGKEYQVDFKLTEGGCVGHVEEVGAFNGIGVTATSPHKIKIALKKKLMDLGCEFEAETRSVDETE